MKPKVTLTITSLLSILFFAFHWVDEITRGLEPGGISGLFGVLILVVWLYGTLVLGERRSGYIVMFLGSVFGLAVLIVHMTRAGLVGGSVGHSNNGVFFWVWTLIALGVTSAVAPCVAFEDRCPAATPVVIGGLTANLAESCRRWPERGRISRTKV